MALSAAGAFVLLRLEAHRPLRQRVEPAARRRVRNVVLAATSGIVVQLIERPLVGAIVRYTSAKRRGLLYQIKASETVRAIAGAVLMDYTLYLWHVLMHRWPALWRLHMPHHADLDLDASTGLRFHFTEMLASAPFRAAQVALLGISPGAFRLWQNATIGLVLFHHSNIRLPLGAERLLAWLVTTPRMHGIHHSSVRDECDSNWSSGLSVWDRLHGTFRFDIPQDQIRIGVPAMQDPARLGVADVLSMPFRACRQSWRDKQGRRWLRGPAGEIRKVAG